MSHFLLSISVAALSGQLVSSASAHQKKKKKDAALALFPVTSPSGNKIRRCILFFSSVFLIATACQQLITAAKMRLLCRVERPCDLC